METLNVDVLVNHPDYKDDLSYFSLSPMSISIPKPPVFLLGSVPAALTQPIFTQFEIGPVGLYQINGGCLSGHSVPFYQGIGLTSPLWNIHAPLFDLVAAECRITDWAVPTRYIDEDVVSIAGPGRTVWGHWLIDFLPRLYVLHLAGYNIWEMKYVLSDNTPNFAYELLRLVGIKKSSIYSYNETSELIGFRKLIVPSYLRWANRLPSLFGEAINFITKSIERHNDLPSSPIKANRLFVSRSSSHDQRSLSNREEIERLVVERGFSIVEPSSYSILEQIAIFKDVKQVVGEYGSALHNVIFSQPGISVCALRGSSHHPAFIQSGISDTLNQSIGYVFGETPLDAWEQVYAIDPNHLKWALNWLDIKMKDL